MRTGMGDMAEPEWRQFLTTPMRPGMLGTVRVDGRSHMPTKVVARAFLAD